VSATLLDKASRLCCPVLVRLAIRSSQTMLNTYTLACPVNWYQKCALMTFDTNDGCLNLEVYVVRKIA